MSCSYTHAALRVVLSLQPSFLPAGRRFLGIAPITALAECLVWPGTPRDSNALVLALVEGGMGIATVMGHLCGDADEDADDDPCSGCPGNHKPRNGSLVVLARCPLFCIIPAPTGFGCFVLPHAWQATGPSQFATFGRRQGAPDAQVSVATCTTQHVLWALS